MKEIKKDAKLGLIKETYFGRYETVSMASLVFCRYSHVKKFPDFSAIKFFVKNDSTISCVCFEVIFRVAVSSF